MRLNEGFELTTYAASQSARLLIQDTPPPQAFNLLQHCSRGHNQYAVRVMTRAVSFIKALAIDGKAAPPALIALCP